MWIPCQLSDKIGFRDIFLRKIRCFLSIEYLYKIKRKRYEFIPNHSYNFYQIEREINYLTGQDTKPTYFYPIKYIKNNVSISNQRRLKILHSCIINMTEDAQEEINHEKPLTNFFNKNIINYLYYIELVLILCGLIVIHKRSPFCFFIFYIIFILVLFL